MSELDPFRYRHHGRLHVQFQKVRHRQHLRHVRNLKGRFRVRVQHDLRVPQIRILWSEPSRPPRCYSPPASEESAR